jgi:hypothetical protein
MIIDIASLIRGMNDDNSAEPKHEDPYYTEKIILALGDLEGHFGKIVTRVSKYQFIPMRGTDKNVEYEDDGVTPKIDPLVYYNPDPAESGDTHVPSDAIVNQGLSKKDGSSYALLESADFYDEVGLSVHEEDVAFIKINVVATSEAVFTVDVSLDGRETWIVADYGKVLSFENGSTGFVDVSDIPSSRLALKWKVTSGTVKTTIFERFYIQEALLRNYTQRIAELAYARILDIDLKAAIENQNDPLVINGIRAQIQSIRDRYGMVKGAAKTSTGSPQAAIYYPDSRSEDAVFGYPSAGEDLLRDGRVIGITNTGQIRRT